MIFIKKIKKEFSSIKKLFSFVLRNGKKECAFVLVICAFTAFMYPLLLEFNYNLIHIIESNDAGGFTTVIILIAAVILSSGIFRLTRCSNLLLFEKMQIKIGTGLMGNIYSLVGRIKHNYFDNPENVAKLKRIVLFSQDSMLTQNIVHFISLVCNAISLVLIFPVIYRAGAEVFFMIFIVAVIGNIFNFNEGNLRWEHQKKQEKKKIRRDKVKSYFYNKEAIMEMRMLHSNDFIQEMWENLNKETYKEDYLFEKKIENRKFVFDILQIVLNILPLLYVSWKFGTGNISIALVFLIWQTQGQFNGIMSAVFSEFKAVHYSIPYIDELCDFMMQDISREEKTQTDSKDIIELKDVSFSYTEGNPILKHINLKVSAGEKIAIIGSNGAGKTTLVKLLAGLYQPASGEMVWGVDEKELGAVWQDYVKFELMLSESVGLGDISKISETGPIMELCSKLGIDTEDISSDDIIGRSFDPEGKIPSEGQWQKIAIARAVYGDKTFLIMDEPTASLDPISEVTLYKQIKETFSDKTVIFVSHRAGFTNLADRILFVKDGSIAEDGNHQQLMKKKGCYYNFYKEQLKWYEGVDIV